MRAAGQDARIGSALHEIFDRLLIAYGPQHWWPADTKTEIVIGAILTQNTAWTNVERAMANLRAARGLTWSALRDLSERELATLIRPCGTYRVKARRIKTFVDTIWRAHGGSLGAMLSGELGDVRRRLLAISGVGPETADAILLYAGNRPTFVADTYTQRLMRRHFLVESGAEYGATQERLHRFLPREARMFNEFHALIVAVGKSHCRARARCDGCPLADMPHDASL